MKPMAALRHQCTQALWATQSHSSHHLTHRPTELTNSLSTVLRTPTNLESYTHANLRNERIALTRKFAPSSPRAVPVVKKPSGGARINRHHHQHSASFLSFDSKCSTWYQLAKMHFRC